MLFFYGVLTLLPVMFCQTSVSSSLSDLERLAVTRNNIIVSGRSKIYKFDNQLNLLITKSTVDLETTLLAEFTYQTDIIVCYVSELCEIRNADDLEIKTTAANVGSAGDPAGLRGIALMQSPHVKNFEERTPAVNVVWIAKTRNSKDVGFSIHLISDLSVHRYTAASSIFHSSIHDSSLKYDQTQVAIELEYLEIFSYKAHKYVVKNSGGTGRIASVCENDSRLSSYMELPVQCGAGYTFIQASFVTTSIGENLKSELGTEIGDTDMYLFMIFGTSRDSSESKLCAIRVRELIPVFNDIFSECMIANRSSTVQLGPEEWLVGKTDRTCDGENPIYVNGQDTCSVTSNSGYERPTFSPIWRNETYDSVVHLMDLKTRATAMSIVHDSESTILVYSDGDKNITKALVGRNASASRVYRTESVPDPLLPSLYVIDNAIYTLTTLNVYKMDLYQCSEAKSCHDCTAMKDPYCGWCALSRSCTTMESCAWRSTENNWLQSRCLESELKPGDKLVSVEVINAETPRPSLTIYSNFLPGSSDPQYRCCFRLDNQTVCRAVTLGNITRGEVDKVSATCQLPDNICSYFPMQGNSVDSVLDLTLNNLTFASVQSTFFDCSVYDSCSLCSRDSLCGWCAVSSKCSNHTSSVCPRESVHRSSSSCARIEPVAGITEFLIPSGSNVSTTGGNILFNVFEAELLADLLCVLEWDGKSQEFQTVRNETNQVYGCELTMSLVYDSKEETKPVTFSVVRKFQNMNIRLDNNQGITVKMYKCEEMAGACGSCLTDPEEKYRCGWCRSRRTSCKAKTQCESTSEFNATLIERDSGFICPDNEITSVSPLNGTIQGETNITIKGVNLGQTFDDIRDAVYVETGLGNITCTPSEDATRLSTKIVCTTTAVSAPTDGHILILLTADSAVTSRLTFKFREPSIETIWPIRGPQSGGTKIIIQGQNINIGLTRFIRMFSDDSSTADILSEEGSSPHFLEFTTPAQSAVGHRNLVLHVDGYSSTQYNFTYMEDAIIKSVVPSRGLVSGGTNITAHGTNLDIVLEPMMYLVTNRAKRSTDINGPKGPCNAINSTVMTCLVPAAPQANGTNMPQMYDFGFIMDGIESTLNLSGSSDSRFQRFEIGPDPTFETFDKQSISSMTLHTLSIKGSSLLYIGDETVVKPMIKVILRENPMSKENLIYCNITSVSDSVISCELMVGLLRENANYVTTVLYGENVQANIGIVSKASEPGFDWKMIAGISAAVVSIVIVVIIVIGVYRRKYKHEQDNVKHLQLRMDSMELQVAKECKEAFAELQTDMSAETAEIAKLSGLPWLDFQDYAMKVLFPSCPDGDHPVLRQLEGLDRGPATENGLREFGKLIYNKTFLLTFIRTLESQQSFNMKDRVEVASLLSVAFQDHMEYHTIILKALLTDLIDRTVTDSKKEVRLLLRRAESVAEKMSSNWFTLLLHQFLKECAGEPLYLLYRAIKQQIDKGPVDAITSDAKYSLSEGKLLRQRENFRTVTLKLHDFYEKQEPPQIKVLSCDTISQALDKVLDSIYRNMPYSDEHKPMKETHTLEWIKPSGSGLLMLDDDPNYARINAEHRALVTIADYGLPENADVRLAERINYDSLRNGNYHKSTLTKHDMSASVLGSPGSQLGSTSNILETSGREKIVHVYHLVKSNDNETQHHHQDSDRNKMVSEVYLTRLLATKGTLQSFVDDLFEMIFSTTHRGSALPLSIKYMFDFLDEQACRHNITDPDVIHKWKSNSLPLRFWVNVIKNPDFVFDIHKSHTVDACLSVVAQIFMESCTTSEHRLGINSPSTKLLYAKDIPRYQKWVHNYYQDIKMMPAISEKEMAQTLSEESKLQSNPFNVTAAFYKLYQYSLQYDSEIMEALDNNEARCDNLKQRLQGINQMLNFTTRI